MNNHFNCIYCYVNKFNNKKYIGQAKNFNKRHRKHISNSYNKNYIYEYNFPFHRAIRKYGVENFEIIILKENLPTQCLLNFYECYYINKFNTLTKSKQGYNVSSGGSNGNNFAGKSEEEMNIFRKKVSENNAKYWSGKQHSKETKQKMSKIKTGKQHSEKTKQKMSKVMKFENNPMYGKQHSKETKRKISKAKNGKLIARYDLSGKLIDIKYNFEYVEMGFNHANIFSCCSGKRKSVGRGKDTEKFIFKYYKED